MKTLIVAVAFGLTAVGALAQGQFNFGNRVTASNINAPVSKADGTLLAGSEWVAQAYVGLAEGSLSPIGSALEFRTGAAAGYISTTALDSGFAGGTEIYVELRAWEKAKGASYEAAQAGGGLFGKSAAIKVIVAVAPTPPPDMVGLTSFSLVPEPSTMALGVLGAAALLLRRRK